MPTTTKAMPRAAIPSAQTAPCQTSSAHTQPSLKDTLQHLGLKQTEFAQLIDVSPRTVSQWATGDGPLPGPVAGYLRMLKKLSAKDRATELAHVTQRKKMFDDGVYTLRYTHADDDDSETGSALAVLRSGKIIGSDRWGGVFSGSYEFDAETHTNTMHVRLSVPPEGELITGHRAGPDGATIDIVGSFERATPVSSAAVDVAGQPVDVELTYLGPLPS